MTAPPQPENPPDKEAKARRDQLVGDWLDARAGAEKYATIAKQLAEQLIREVGVGHSHELLPGVGIRVQAPARTFNADRAHAVLTPDQYSAICEPVPSVKLAELVLPGTLVDQCKVSGARPSVREL
jgi:hypothetical protein